MNLCACSHASTLEEFRGDVERATAAGAHWVELRLDLLLPTERQRLLGEAPWFRSIAERLVVTFRPMEQGGEFDGSSAERLSLLLWFSELRPRLVDVEFACYGRSAETDGKIGLVPEWRDGRPHGLLLSEHHPDSVAQDPAAKLQRMLDCPAEAIKLAWLFADARDTFAALDLQRRCPRGAVFGLGPDGLASRVLGRKFGSFVTYAALRRGEETGPGQPTVSDLVDTYHWPQLTSQTAVYGVVGDPVHHSLSPHVHNAAFADAGLDAVYLPWRVPGTGHAFDEFLAAVVQRPWLHIRGLSVTAPHKLSAFQQVTEPLDPLTRRIGAVNTLSFDGDRILGSNTDYKGALGWITRSLGCQLPDLAGTPIAVLGAGGLARTVGVALSLLRAELTFVGRSPRRTAALAAQCGGNAQPFDGGRLDQPVVINCTPCGTWPAVDDSPLRDEQLPRGGHVFDAVYNPGMTRLRSQAEAAGCTSHGGLDLFIDQAALQFAAWTGRVAPRAVMKAAAERALTAALTLEAPSH